MISVQNESLKIVRLDIQEKNSQKMRISGLESCTNFTRSSLIQLNDTDVYAIGGLKGYCSLLPDDYDVARSCLKIDL